MSLAPILPGTSPLPPSGQRPPDRRALRVATLITLPILLISLLLGQLTLPRLVFFGPGLQAEAGGLEPGVASTQFQGFVYWWTRRQATDTTRLAFTSPGGLQNLRLQANTFHMNTVIIPVVADMPRRSEGVISFDPKDTANKDTLTDDDYKAVIEAARKAGLVPILELVLRQQDPGSKRLDGTLDESSELVGKAWYNTPSTASYGKVGGGTINVGTSERAWFNAYTTFAVHFAQMSQQYHLPYFIVGSRLPSVSFDTNHTNRDPNDPKKSGDPQGVDTGLTTDPAINTCTGRHDCGWRHVVNAIRSDSYGTFTDHKPQVGANYKGKLIYAASWGPTGSEEYSKITWWDAVDYIGIDAYVPMSTGTADLSVDQLVDIWHGKGDNPSPAGDAYGQMGKIADQFQRPIVFTSAGYESMPASNATPGGTPITDSSDEDQLEQFNDMRALLTTFSSAPWWAGVFWYAEQPITPHNTQPGWKYSTAWAGDDLASSKQAGQFLAHYYQPRPLPCSC